MLEIKSLSISDVDADHRASTRCFAILELFEQIMLHYCDLCDVHSRWDPWAGSRQLRPGILPFRMLLVSSTWRASALETKTLRRRLFLDPAPVDNLLFSAIPPYLTHRRLYTAPPRRPATGMVIPSPHDNLAGDHIAAPRRDSLGSVVATLHPVLAGTTYGSCNTNLVFRLTGHTVISHLGPGGELLSDLQKQMLVTQPACKTLSVRFRVDWGKSRFATSYDEQCMVANEDGVRLRNLFEAARRMAAKWKAEIANRTGGKNVYLQRYRERIAIVITADGFVSSERKDIKGGKLRRRAWMDHIVVEGIAAA